MRFWVGLGVIACVTSACGTSPLDVEQNLPASQVEAGWDATHSVLSGITLDTGAELSIPAASQSFVHTCMDGGSAWVDSDTVVEVAVGSLDAEVFFYVEFDECRKNGVLITGSMVYSRRFILRGGSLDVTFGWEGDVQWSGGVEGYCGVQLAGETATEHVVMGRSLVEITGVPQLNGTICGLDAARDLDWALE